MAILIFLFFKVLFHIILLYPLIRCFASIASRIRWAVYVFTALHFYAGAPLESNICFLVFTSPPRTAQTATRNVFQKRVKMSPPLFVTAPQVNYILLFCFDHYYDRSLYILFSRHCASFVINHHPDVPRFTFSRHSSSAISANLCIFGTPRSFFFGHLGVLE